MQKVFFYDLTLSHNISVTDWWHTTTDRRTDDNRAKDDYSIC